MREPEKSCPIPYPFGEEHGLDLDEHLVALCSQGLTRVTLPYGGDAWLATGYHDVRQVLSDARFSRQMANAPDKPRLSSEVLPTSSMMAMDAPEQTQLRRALAGAFTTRAVERLRPEVRRLTQEATAAFVEGGSPQDLVAELTAQLPMRLICAVLGVPSVHSETFLELAGSLRSRDLEPEERLDARRRFEQFVSNLIDQTEADDSPTLLKQLSDQVGDPSEPLTAEQLIDIVVAVLVGGVGSPSTFMASSVFLLLRSPVLWARMVANPSSVPAVVEELLRVVPIGVAGGFPRVARSDVLVGEILVEAGETVLPAMIAGNRDSRVFPDSGRFEPGRSRPAHLGFGHGSHHCVGAHLARVEAQEFLTELAHALPSLRLSEVAKSAVWSKGLVVRELETLIVEW